MPLHAFRRLKRLSDTTESEYRQAMAWEKIHPLEDIYHTLIALRKEHPALRYGNFMTIIASNKVYSYSRT